MHNRLRMITSQFLSKHLLIDWRKGEAFFARHLVDMDFASNNGGWQWSSSTGTDSAPYFRVFNPTTQGQRFDASFGQGDPRTKSDRRGSLEPDRLPGTDRRSVLRSEKGDQRVCRDDQIRGLDAESTIHQPTDPGV